MNVLKIIEQNPYRILGVYSTSPKKEIVANQGRMKAFLKVGRTCEFPLDLPTLLPPIARTEESVADANARLTLPQDQLKYAQFWFVKCTSLDDVAFNHLLSGNTEQAVEIWAKKDNASSLQNRIVCALAKGSYGTAIQCAEKLYTNFSKELVAMVLGENATISADKLHETFLDAVLEAQKPAQILGWISIAQWKEYVAKKSTKPLIDGILAAVEAAKASKGQGARARFNAGTKLMNDTKAQLAQLKSLLQTSGLEYQMVADKLGLEILQCGIDYFNATEDDDAPTKAAILQNYAYAIVVGQMAKERCKENVDILKSVGEEYPVRKELSQLANIIKNLRGDSQDSRLCNLAFFRSISDIHKEVNRSIPLLKTVQSKLGINNSLCLNVSSAVASAAVNALVEIINREQTLALGDREKLKIPVKDALSLMSTISTMSMDSRTRDYYNKTRASLANMDNQLNPSGCYIATMVYGDYNHPQVMVLRHYRDSYLAKRAWGRNFIKLYYKYSPRLVEHLKDYTSINNVIRGVLDGFVKVLKKNNY